VRSYASVPSSVKSIFNMRRLHTGHVAHSFGLAETPTTLGASFSSAERKKRKLQAAGSALRSRKKAVHRGAQQLQGGKGAQQAMRQLE
jgi:ATP-dependent RNA helicase DDX31/DBP7